MTFVINDNANTPRFSRIDISFYYWAKDVAYPTKFTSGKNVPVYYIYNEELQSAYKIRIVIDVSNWGWVSTHLINYSVIAYGNSSLDVLKDETAYSLSAVSTLPSGSSLISDNVNAS